MKRFDDEKLEIFLKENRPLHPRHSERDAEKIWAQISRTEKSSFWTWPRLAVGGLATALAVAFLAFNLTFQQQAVTVSGVDETALVEESLDLEFMENGEIYEVTDLLSLSN